MAKVVLAKADTPGSHLHEARPCIGGASQQGMNTISPCLQEHPHPVRHHAAIEGTACEEVSKSSVFPRQAIALPMWCGVRRGGEKKYKRDKKLTSQLPFDLTPKGWWGVAGYENLRRGFTMRRRAGSNWRPDDSGRPGGGDFWPPRDPPIKPLAVWGGGDVVMRKLVYGGRVGAGRVHVQLQHCDAVCTAAMHHRHPMGRHRHPKQTAKTLEGHPRTTDSPVQSQ